MAVKRGRTRKPASQPAVKEETTEEVKVVDKPKARRVRRTRAQIEADKGGKTAVADEPKSAPKSTGKMTQDEAIVALGKNLKEQKALNLVHDKALASLEKEFAKDMGVLTKEYDKVKNFI